MPLTKATQNVISPNICTTDTVQTITADKAIVINTSSCPLSVSQSGIGNAFEAGNIVDRAYIRNSADASTILGLGEFASTTGGTTQIKYSRLFGTATIGIGQRDNPTTAITITTNGSVFTKDNFINNTIIKGDTGTGVENTAVGGAANQSLTSGNYNTAVGAGALQFSNASENTAVGRVAGQGISGSANTAVGVFSLYSSSGSENTAIGRAALIGNTTGQQNTALGANALNANLAFNNCSGFGNSSQVTGSNQVQLGDSVTTVYAYGAVQNRSDIRDKADVRDTELGLDFVNALRPVDFKWDMREDYRPEAPAPVIKPADLKEDATEEEKAKYAQELAAYNAYKVELDKWLEDVKLANITHDGSKKRSRFHHGLIAQEVKAVLDAKGIDFGGFQDHSVKDGDDVLSIGYVELIAPMLKAIQELSAKVAELEAK